MLDSQSPVFCASGSYRNINGIFVWYLHLPHKLSAPPALKWSCEGNPAVLIQTADSVELLFGDIQNKPVLNRPTGQLYRIHF